MSKRLRIIFAASVLLTPGIPHAQSYPSRPIRLVVAYAGGSSPDIGARRLANELSKQMGQQVVVDNRPGASTIIGTELVARAAPDGYTFGYIGANFVTNLHLFKSLPYDSLRDFQPVILTGSNAHLLAATPSLPIRSVKELIELARAKPDALSYGSAGNGSSPHLTMELLKSMTGTQILHVAYKGTQQALSDVMSGQIHLVCNPIAAILPQVKTGQVRALGITSLKRSTAAPEILTLDESGIRGYESIGWSGYVLPARAPREIALRLNAEINKAYLSPSIVKAVADIGGTVIGGAPGRLTQQIRQEIEIYGKLFKALGIAPQ